MPPRRTIALFGIAAVIVIAAFAVRRGPDTPPPARRDAETLHDAAPYFDRDLFFRGVTAAEREGLLTPLDAAASESGRIRAAIVPHHYVGSRYIADIFMRLATQRPRTVLLIGPNHDERGEFAMLASEAAWRTEFGTVPPDRDAVDALVRAGAVHVDEATVAGDHAVAGLVPFVARYLPDATVVPVLLKRHPTPRELDTFAAALADALADSDTVLVGSVDFSHYLTADQADAKDEETLAALRAGDDRQLLGFDNSHADSPQTVVAVLRAMRVLHARDAMLVAHENSGRVLGDPLAPTTSYLTLVWKE